MSKTIYNGVLLNSVSEIYKVVVSIFESQNQFIFTMIINRLLEEYRKIIGGKNGEMKMALLTNQASKTDKKKKSGYKIKVKSIKHCFICSKAGHVEEEY